MSVEWNVYCGLGRLATNGQAAAKHRRRPDFRETIAVQLKQGPHAGSSGNAHRAPGTKTKPFTVRGTGPEKFCGRRLVPLTGTGLLPPVAVNPAQAQTSRCSPSTTAR
jgi:hypothetical protein